MRNGVKVAIGFVAGLAAGAIGGYEFSQFQLRKELKRIADEPEIKDEEVKQAVEEATKIVDEHIEKLEKVIEKKQPAEKEEGPEDEYIEEPATKKEKMGYNTKVVKEGYKPAANKSKERKSNPSNNDIEIIDPDEFGMSKSIDINHFCMYEDGVVVDEDDNIIISPIDYIGEEAYNALSSGEETTVFVRNYTKKMDYSIARSFDCYYDEVRSEMDETVD